MEKQFKVLNFPEILVFTPKKFLDIRGVFFENFNSNVFTKQTQIIFEIVQENVSFSHKNVLRGLHFQKGNNAQSKLISVIKGSILDVIVDIRSNSKNFGKWISYSLDDKNKESIYIPSGFAHGFLALEDLTKISYKVDKTYNQSSECSILWNDKSIAVDWPSSNPILSEKDGNALSFEKNYKMNNFKIV